MTLHIQFLTMTSMIAGGFYLGLILDTFRRLTSSWSKGKILTYVLEIGFWLCQMFILYYILYRVNSGELRFYVILACLLGFSIYKVIAAQIYRRILEHVIRFLKFIVYYTGKMIQMLVITPIWFILQSVFIIVIAIVRFLLAGLRFVLKVIFFPLKWVFGLLYSLLPSRIQKIVYKLGRIYSIIKNTCSKWVEYIINKRR